MEVRLRHRIEDKAGGPWQKSYSATPSRSRFGNMRILLNRYRQGAAVYDFCHGPLAACHTETTQAAMSCSRVWRLWCASETGESCGMEGVHHVNYPFDM